MVKTSILFFTTSFISLILLILSNFSNYNIIYSYLSVLLFLYFILVLIKNSFEYSAIFSYLLLAIIPALIISITLEHGVFLVEINQLSYSTALPIKASLQLLGFIFSSYITFALLRNTSIKVIPLTLNSDNLIKYLLYSVIILIVISLWGIILRYGTPMSHHIHRNDYWSLIAPSWGSTLVYLLVQLNFFLGLSFSRKSNRIDVFLFSLIMVTIILLGERLTGLLYSLFFFLIPWSIVNFKDYVLVFTFKHKLYIAVFLVLVAYVLFKNFANIATVGSLSAWESISLRTSLQSQMWWALDNISSLNSKDISLVIDHYIGIGNNPRYTGTYYLMDLVADSDIVDDRYSTNSKFTLSGFFNNVYYFGYIFGYITNFLWGILFGALGYLVYLGITSRNYLFALISFKFFYKIQAIILVASTPDFFTFNTLLYIILCTIFLKFNRAKI